MSEEVRARLLAQLAASQEHSANLANQYARLVEASEASNADDEHDPEGATIAYERQQLASMMVRAEHREAELRAALARVLAGTYGSCERCGGPVGAERLEVCPQVRSCITCARAG